MWTFAAIFILAFAGCQGEFSEEQQFFLRGCADDEVISEVTSKFVTSDRVWSIECQKFQSKLSGCTWTRFLKAYEKPVHFNCKANYVMTGVYSIYNDDHKDRMWNFRCCTADNLVTYDCGETPKVNYFTENFKWSVPGSNYMTGIRMYGSDNHNDYRWTFSYCRAAVFDPQMANSQIVRANHLLRGQLTEGDIAIPLSRSATTCTNCIWPKTNGLVQVPYTIHSSFSTADKEAILFAMTGIHLSTCVRFVPASGHTDWVSIESREGCWSYVGRTGGTQQLSLGGGCLGVNTIQHELIHALGFWHEHSRTDRDLFVKIHWENIQDGQMDNFKKQDTHNLNIAYDLASLMHYGPTDFSKNGGETITPLDESVQITQGIGMTDKDVQKINKLYDCTDYLHKNGAWDHKLNEDLIKMCPYGQAISSITSFYDDSTRDRLWGITCKPFVETKACFWSSQSDLWRYLDFKCSDNSVIAGVQSIHDGVLQDRRWAFMCCNRPDFTLTNCKEGPVINHWGEFFHWKVAGNNYLTGVKSSIDISTKDRRWSFNYCQKA